MEIVRQQLGNGNDGEFRARQLRARQMLTGELDGSDLDAYVEERVMTTTMDKAANWARGNAFMPATFGLACCAIEMMAAVNARMDIARFGFEAFRASPRQADLMIVAGTVNFKMGERVKRLYDQMPSPKYVIAMGACATGGGPYFKFGYTVMKGVDRCVPVDVYIAGCPPRPEALLEGLMKLQEKIQQSSVIRRPARTA